MFADATCGTRARIALLGGGGHASDVLGAIEAINAFEPRFEVIGCFDDGAPDPDRLAGRSLPLLGTISDVKTVEGCLVVGAVGYPGGRRAVVDKSRPLPLCPPILHPTSVAGSGSTFGLGTVVLALTQISALVSVGENVLISYGALVGHDSIIEDDVSIMPGAVVSGEVRVGVGALIGTNATILEGRCIGAGATVGAGALVTRDVAPGQTVVGSPARERERSRQ